MPSRNLIKIYVENSFYHIYNRGVEKRKIFKDTQDFKVFHKYLKDHLLDPVNSNLLPHQFSVRGKSFKGIPRQPKNYAKEIELIAYSLMPNHFHLLIKQNEKKSIEKFMRSLATRYSMYFNKKYNRVGKLFQGRYKACLITQDSYLLHLTRYIHLNPSEFTSNLEEAFSSYADYLGIRKTKLVKPEFVLKFFEQAKKDLFRGTNTYKAFVEGNPDNSRVILENLILED